MLEHVRLLRKVPTQRPARCRARAVPGITGVLGILALAQAPGASAVDANRGRQLYENQCQACHSNLLHTQQARKIETLNGLQQRVTAWGIHAGQDWGLEEVNDVTLYLDRAFYHFGGTQR